MTPSLVDIDSSGERLRKLTLTDVRAASVSFEMARARTSVIATVAAIANVTRDDSVKRIYVKLSLSNRTSHFCAAAPCMFKQVRRRATTHTLD